ncbi:hypothetical protein MANES_01G066175v8 [Manihot esculenta]|uniref:Uncharacterized protein n=1 Tax=Manihot esculenta TaxID=3983 RepID=A0ACB7ID47_MANES|nr:hypothetical protein MANES_01G066175v8 [Manihot esculenta]
MVSSTTINIIHVSGRSLVSINCTQFLLKLTVTNYSTWKAQVSPLLKGHSLMGYILGTVQIPPASKLSLYSSSVSDVDLVVQVLEGVGLEFCDTVISFDELQDKLLAHKLYLKQIDPSYEVASITANHVRKSNYSKSSSKQNSYGR